MGKIFYLMGKSATGKDTLYQRILAACPGLKTVVLYTTRPMRDGEQEGIEYHFIDRDRLEALSSQGKIVETRTYQTVHGPWDYATVDDGQIDIKSDNYLIIGTLESYEKLRLYFGDEVMVPLYVEVDDGIRLIRALEREQRQAEPKYREVCRRFLADEEDFSSENLEKSKIKKVFKNKDLEECLQEILEEINRLV